MDLSGLPQSSYLKKRAEFRQKRRCKHKKTSEISENESLHSDEEFEVKSEVDSDEYEQSPSRARQRDESGESTSSMAMQPLELSSRTAIGTEYFLFQKVRKESNTNLTAPPMMYSPEDEHLVGLLVSLENHSRDEVPMSPLVKTGIIESLKSGLPFPYKVSLEGYTTAVQRLAHFISKIDAFNAINLEDRRSLIGMHSYSKMLVLFFGNLITFFL